MLFDTKGNPTERAARTLCATMRGRTSCTCAKKKKPTACESMITEVEKVAHDLGVTRDQLELIDRGGRVSVRKPK